MSDVLRISSRCRVEQGCYRETKKASDQMARNVAPILKEVSILEAFAIEPWLVEIRFTKCDCGDQAAQAVEGIHDDPIRVHGACWR